MTAKHPTITLLVIAAAFIVLQFGRAAGTATELQTDNESPEIIAQVAQLDAKVSRLTKIYEESSGFKDSEYLLRIQGQYEAYYEKAFNSQVMTIWGIGIFLTIIMAFAGRFGFRMFDRQIDYTIRGVTSELRATFESRLLEELGRLRSEHKELAHKLEVDSAQRTNEAMEKIDVQSKAFGRHTEGLAMLAMKDFVKARDSYMDIIKLYIAHKSKDILSLRQGARAVASYFGTFHVESPKHFESIVKSRLDQIPFTDLHEEVMEAADLLPPLKDVIQSGP